MGRKRFHKCPSCGKKKLTTVSQVPCIETRSLSTGELIKRDFLFKADTWHIACGCGWNSQVFTA